MSRSRKKTPIFGITSAESEKEDKTLANSRNRRSVNQRLADLHKHLYVDPDLDDEEVFPDIRETSNRHLMAKDGRRYDAEALSNPRKMRK